MTARDDFKAGRDSGFPICCVLFYIFRSVFHYLTGKRLNFTAKRKFKHIPCLFHAFLPAKEYYTCEGCDWTQYGNPTCNKCKGCKHEFEMEFHGPTCKKCDFVKNITTAKTVIDETNQSVSITYIYK